MTDHDMPGVTCRLVWGASPTGRRYIVTAPDGRRHITRAQCAKEAEDLARHALGCQDGDAMHVEAVTG